MLDLFKNNEYDKPLGQGGWPETTNKGVVLEKVPLVVERKVVYGLIVGIVAHHFVGDIHRRKFSLIWSSSNSQQPL